MQDDFWEDFISDGENQEISEPKKAFIECIHPLGRIPRVSDYLRDEENTWDWNSSWKTEEARQMEAKRAAGSSLSAAGSSRVGDEEEVEVVDAIAEFRAPPHHLTMKGAKWTI